MCFPTASSMWHSAAVITTQGGAVATLENLQAKIGKLQAQAEAVAKKQSSTVIAKIRELMENTV